MNTLMLSSKSYKESKEHDFGDCFISDNGNDVVVFDCGSNEHAEKVIEYLENNYGPDKKAIIVLSHNDSDHFNGIPKLIEENKVEKVYTILLLKFYEELLEEIDDDRKTKDSIKRQILERYSNIASLLNTCFGFDIRSLTISNSCFVIFFNSCPQTFMLCVFTSSVMSFCVIFPVKFSLLLCLNCTSILAITSFISNGFVI